MSSLSTTFDFDTFASKVTGARVSSPERLLAAGRNLVDGAMRIRRGGDGIYGQIARPATKPVEAIGAWLESIERDHVEGEPFNRTAEAREALVAAAEEVNAATVAMPSAQRLQHALYTDALATIGTKPASSSSFWPWIIASALGGILVGVLFFGKRR